MCTIQKETNMNASSQMLHTHFLLSSPSNLCFAYRERTKLKTNQTKCEIIRVTYEIRQIYTKNYIPQLQTKWIKNFSCTKSNRTNQHHQPSSQQIQQIVIIIKVIIWQKVCICLASFNNLYGFFCHRIHYEKKAFICEKSVFKDFSQTREL